MTTLDEAMAELKKSLQAAVDAIKETPEYRAYMALANVLHTPKTKKDYTLAGDGK